MSRTIFVAIYSNDGHHVMSPLVVTMATVRVCAMSKLHLHLNRQLWIAEMNNDTRILELKYVTGKLDEVKVK
jgi:hypothetical protein